MNRSIFIRVGVFSTLFFFIPFFLLGCKKDSPSATDPVARGKAVYLSACIACHHSDPRQAGILGPEVAGSSLELLEARIMRAEYPAGHIPKRPSRTMVAMPQLKGDIAALHAYLNSL